MKEIVWSACYIPGIVLAFGACLILFSQHCEMSTAITSPFYKRGKGSQERLSHTASKWQS